MAKPYPILMTRTPYSVKPYGVDQYQDNLGPSALFGKAGYIFVYQDVRGRWMSEGEFVNMRPHTRPRGEGHRREHRHLRHHRLAAQERAGPQRQGRPVGHLVSGLLHRRRHDRRPPGPEGRSPQAPVTDWFIGDDWHHNGALFLPHMFNFMARFEQPRPEPTKKFDPDLRPRNAGRLRVLPRDRPAQRRRQTLLQGRVGFWDEAMKHGTYDEFWKARNIRAAPQGHQAGRDDRRRLVRRREPVRGPGGLSQPQEELRRDRATGW